MTSITAARSRTRLLVVLLVSTTGCSTQGLRVLRLEPGSECPAGGLRITTGSMSALICNGTSGASGDAGSDGRNGSNGADGSNGTSALARQVLLEVGDTRCPLGGVLLRVGTDSGADGGIAGDGILQDEEVSSEAVVCHGSTGLFGSLERPTTPAGTAVIRAKGGAGAQLGGNGGSIRLESKPNGGGHLKVWRNGRANASPTAVTAPPSQPSATPLIIQSNTVIPMVEVAADGVMFPPSTPFATSDDDALYISQGTGGAPRRVTSLRIEAGAVLTLPHVELDALEVLGRCEIDGVLTVEGSTDRLSLSLACDEFLLGTNSLVDGTGPNVPVDITLTARRALIARGSVSASARSTATMRGAGNISMSSARLVNEGSILARGASSTIRSVTVPGGITLQGGVENSGLLDASAGEHTSASGASQAAAGGDIALHGTAIKNRGRLVSNGGANSAASCPDCLGGRGGTIRIQSVEKMTNEAELAALGGSSSSGVGGEGGLIEVRASRGSIAFSGSVDVSGGSGMTTGGRGGFVQFQRDGQVLDLGVPSELVLLGYELFDTRGGDGAIAGSGGPITAVMPLQQGVLGGAIVVEADLDASGGSSGTSSMSSSGGQGGRVTVETMSIPTSSWQRAVVSGLIRANGGNGPTGGAGGEVFVTGNGGAVVAGVEAKGGNGLVAASGTGGVLSVTAYYGTALGRAPVDVGSGSAAALGDATLGKGGIAKFEGHHVRLEASIDARGADLTAATGVSGPGGFIEMTSVRTPTVISVSAPQGLNVSAGSGPSRGQPGQIIVDEFEVTRLWAF